MTANNVLAGMACPSCGQDDRLELPVVIRGTVVATDDGFYYGDVRGDSEWDWDDAAEAPALCPECGHRGTLAEFVVEDDDVR